MQYLHLLSFIQHQFYTYQDNLIDVLLSAVQSSINQAEKEQKEQYFASRKAKNQAVKSVTQSRRHYKERWEQAKTIIQSEELADDKKVIQLSELIEAEQDDEQQADQHAQALEKEISPAMQQREYYDVLESKFRRLNNRVGQLLQAIVFHKATSDRRGGSFVQRKDPGPHLFGILFIE